MGYKKINRQLGFADASNAVRIIGFCFIPPFSRTHLIRSQFYRRKFGFPELLLILSKNIPTLICIKIYNILAGYKYIS